MAREADICKLCDGRGSIKIQRPGFMGAVTVTETEHCLGCAGVGYIEPAAWKVEAAKRLDERTTAMVIEKLARWMLSDGRDCPHPVSGDLERWYKVRELFPYVTGHHIDDSETAELGRFIDAAHEQMRRVTQ